MAVKLYSYLFALLVVAEICLAQLPENIQRCHFGDVECMKKVANDILKGNPHGIPGMRIPDLEPFHLDNATFGSSIITHNFNIVFQMKDFDMYGLSKLVIDRLVGFEKNPLKSKFEVYGRMPHLKFKALYNIEGHVLGVPVSGNGPIEAHVKNAEISFKLKMKKNKEIDGKTYVAVKKYKTLFDAQSFHFQLDNLFNGNKVLGDSMNELINDNWSIIWSEMQPHINDDVVGVLAYEILTNALGAIPYEELFLPD